MSQSQELAVEGGGGAPEQFNIEYLLFCHTFSHTEDHISEEDLKMDMVTFPYPVYITELRIIPMDHRSPEGKGQQMGRTQPSESELTIYVDNVYNLQAAVFETFGILKYNTKNFMLKASTLTAATKLLVHGIYTSITLCLYGSPAQPPEQGADPPPLPKLLPPPPADTKPPLPSPSADPPVPSEQNKNQRKTKTKSTTPSKLESHLTPSGTPDNQQSGSKAKRARTSRDGKRTPDESHNVSGERISDLSLIRSDTGEDESTREELLVSGEMLNEMSGHSFNTMEETMDDSNDQTEGELLMEDSWSMSINPSHCQFTPLKFSRNIFSSKGEGTIIGTDTSLSSRHRSSSHATGSSKSKGTNRLRELTRRYRSPPTNEKFVVILEDVVAIMSSGHGAAEAGDYVIQVLVTWTENSLDLNKIKGMPLAVNVRFLRAGLKLFSLLVRCGETAVGLILRHNMINLLMCMVESDLKSSIKIRCIDCMSELIEYPQAMDVFIGTQSGGEQDRLKYRNHFTFYQRFMRFLLRGAKMSLEYVTRELIAKCHLYELLLALQNCVEEIISNNSNLTQEESSSGVWPGATSPKGAKDNSGPVPSPCKATETYSSTAGKPDTELSGCKNGETERDDLDDVLWGGVETGVRMEMECMDDSFTKELLEFQLEDTETKSENKRIAYIGDSLAEKLIRYVNKLHKQLEACSDILDSFPPAHQQTPYKETDPRSKLRYRLSNLVKLLRGRRFLQCVLILLMCQNTQFSSRLFHSLRDLLLLLVRSQTGMLYMLEESECTNTIIRLLVPTDSSSHQIHLPVSEFSVGSKADCCSPDNLGYLIFYHLQVLQLIDELRGLSLDLHRDGLIENNYLESECFRSLHILYSMTSTPLGKHTVVHVLSLEDNILPLLKLVDPPRDDRNKTYNIQNVLSPSAQYVILLLKMLLHLSQSVAFLFRNLEAVVRLVDALKECEYGTLGLLQWIEIFKLFDKREVPQEDRIGRVIKEIELSMDSFSLSHFVEFEPTLLTNLRILSHHLRGVRSKDSATALDSTITINYIVSSNGVYILTQLIHKVTDILLPLWRHGLILKPSETHTLLSLAGNSVYILKLVLVELLSVEGMSYNNSLLLRSLFTLFCLVSPQRAFLSDSACVRHIAVQISGDIVDICSAFLRNKVVSLQPVEEEQKMDTEQTQQSDKETSSTKEPEEGTSPWSFLLSELFEFTLSAPQFFTGGTLLLSELLPIPLPVFTAEEMTSPRITECMKRLREDWSTHMSAFSGECKALIRSTAGTSCPEMHSYIWKCACQIGDLSASLANAITNQLKELLCSQLEQDSLRKEPDKRLSGRSVYLLGTLAVVTQQPSMKSAYLKCLKENFEALKILCDLITREPEICPHPGKLSILMIISSICNPYISLMVSSNESVQLSEYQVANALPGQKELACIVLTLLRHVSMKNQTFSCLLLTLRTLANLSHHDQGMVHFYKYIVEEKTFKFSPVFENILEGLKLLDKNMLSVEDALACVSLLIEFIGVLTIPNFFQQEDSKHQESSQTSTTAPTLKKIFLPTHFIHSELTQHKDYLQLVLDMLIKESSLEQSGVEEFRNHIFRLKSGLEATDSIVMQNEPLPEVSVESLEEQFEKRVVFTVGHQFYFPEYWLPHCPFDQTLVRVDPVFLDLEKIAYETCSGYNLRDELTKLYQSSPSSMMDPNLARHMRMQSYLMSNPGDSQKKFNSLTGSSLLSSSIIHKFQRRKQNTSRPPSLHVDDFVAREQASFPKQPSLIPRSPMTPFLISPIPGNILSSHFPGRVAPGIPLSTPVLATNPIIRSAWPTHLPPYPHTLASPAVRPQSARLYPHHLDQLHESGPLNRSRFIRGDSIQSRSPSNFSAPRSRPRRDATKSCAKLLT